SVLVSAWTLDVGRRVGRPSRPAARPAPEAAAADEEHPAVLVSYRGEAPGWPDRPSRRRIRSRGGGTRPAGRPGCRPARARAAVRAAARAVGGARRDLGRRCARWAGPVRPRGGLA